MTYEADELRRSWKRCLCPVCASGTLGTRFKREEHGMRRLGRSQSRGAWQETASWDGPAKVELPVTPDPAPAARDGRITSDRTIQAFTAEFQATLDEQFPQGFCHLTSVAHSRSVIEAATDVAERCLLEATNKPATEDEVAAWHERLSRKAASQSLWIRKLRKSDGAGRRYQATRTSNITQTRIPEENR